MDIDKECISLCDAINLIPGIHTIESCCGHGEHPYRIWFKARNIKCLPRLLYWFDGCHCGHYGWKVLVKTDCGCSPATFLVEGPIGDQAYKESDHIAELLREEANA